MTSTSKPMPAINGLCADYWQSCQQKNLRIQRCQQCRYWIHFPESVCPKCASTHLQFEAVSGNGTIESFSIVERSFVAGFEQAYAIAWIALPEQNGLRTMSNIINCDLNSLHIGMSVRCVFETRGGDKQQQLPQFTAINNKIGSPSDD